MGEKKIPELLAPAGSFESMKAAVSAGADAVYLGGRKFGARNLASNFTGEELKAAVDYCHSRNVRVYVTHNILVHDDEIADSINELHFLFSIGVDAVLLQDFGILHEASKLFPDLELHASTQMTIHNPEGVLWAEANGVSRVVLSREMSLEDISAVRNFSGTEKTGLEGIQFAGTSRGSLGFGAVPPFVYDRGEEREQGPVRPAMQKGVRDLVPEIRRMWKSRHKEEKGIVLHDVSRDLHIPESRFARCIRSGFAEDRREDEIAGVDRSFGLQEESKPRERPA